MKMLAYALFSSAVIALAPSGTSAADLDGYPPPGGYVEQRPLPPPPACCPQPYYAQPYYPYGAYYYPPLFWRPYPYFSAYPYWRGPRFAYYGPRAYWGRHWGGRGRRW